MRLPYAVHRTASGTVTDRDYCQTEDQTHRKLSDYKIFVFRNLA